MLAANQAALQRGVSPACTHARTHIRTSALIALSLSVNLHLLCKNSNALLLNSLQTEGRGGLDDGLFVHVQSSLLPSSFPGR